MIRVLIVDDHRLIRVGIDRILREHEDIEIVGAAESGEEAINLARSLKPEVILMDINMPGIGGLEAIRKIIHFAPDTKIIALSVHNDDVLPSKVLDAGAMGYLTKDSAEDDVYTAISNVSSGQHYIDAEIARAIALTKLPGNKQLGVDKLSQRELQILLMVSKGHGITDIADKLFISPKTVSTYRYRLFEKLGVHNDVELAMFAVRENLVDPDIDF